MIQKIKNILMAAIVPLTIAAPVVLAPAVSYAAGGCSSTTATGIDQGIKQATGSGNNCTEDSTGAGSLSGVASKVVNLLSIVVGIVAVIMIIIGGFRYIASGGASDKVSGAKNTLIYAIVGLVIVALAQFIVRFVLSNVS